MKSEAGVTFSANGSAPAGVDVVPLATDVPRPVAVSEYAHPDIFDRLPVLHCEDDGLAEPGCAFCDSEP